MIRLWNRSFEEIGKLSRNSFKAEKGNLDLTKSSFSAQSLDVYYCQSTQKEEKVDTILLYGTRNGSVFEVSIKGKEVHAHT